MMEEKAALVIEYLKKAVAQHVAENAELHATVEILTAYGTQKEQEIAELRAELDALKKAKAKKAE